MTRRWIACGLAAVAALAAAAPARAIEFEVQAQLAATAPVSAYGGVVAWSELDAADGRFRLVVRSRGRTRRLPVPGRVNAFDVDLGPDRAGKVTAVYSRCAEDYQGSPGYPHEGPTIGLKCDLYRVPVDGGRERRIASVSGRGTSEYLPSLWRDRLAFARRGERSRPSIVVVDLRTGRTRELRGGSRGPAPDVNAIDLRGDAVAYGWTYWSDDCPPPTRPSDSSATTNSEVWWDVVGGRHRRVATACDLSTRQSSVALPTLGSRGLTYQAVGGEVGGPVRIRTQRSPGAAPREWTFTGSGLMALARDAGELYAVRRAGEGAELVRAQLG